VWNALRGGDITPTVGYFATDIASHFPMTCARISNKPIRKAEGDSKIIQHFQKFITQ
jgi:hypothetical protein